VIVDNDWTLSHRYSLDGVTEVMERRASSPVHSERARPPDAPKKRKHGLRIHPGSGSKPWRMRRPCPLTATC